MSKNIASVNFKLVSQYDNSGVQLAVKDMRTFESSLKGVSSDQAEWMRSLAMKSQKMIPEAASSVLSPDLKDSFAEEIANKQKQLDIEVWTNRARLRDEEVQKEIVATQARAKTEAILSQARKLGVDLESKALQQKQARAANDAQILATIEKDRHDQAMQFIFQEGDAAQGRMLGGKSGSGRGGAGGGGGGSFSPAFASNLQQIGFMAQDFTSQFQNAKTAAEGFGRGISAISNNIQVMGAGLPPMQQAMFAIGGAAAGVIIPAVVKWLDDSKKIEEQTKAIEVSYNNIKGTVSGLKDVAEFGAGLGGGEDAQKQLDRLIGQRTAAARQMNLITKKIDDGVANGASEAAIGGLRKHNTEIAEEYEKLELRIQAIQEHWTPTRLKQAKDRADQLKKEKEAEKTIEEDAEKSMAELRKGFMDDARAEDEQIRRQYDVRQATLRNQIDDMRDERGGTSPNGSSPANIRGSAGAAAAIGRAISGTRSEENDRKHQIKLLEDQLKALNRLEQKMNFKRAGLSA